MGDVTIHENIIERRPLFRGTAALKHRDSLMSMDETTKPERIAEILVIDDEKIVCDLIGQILSTKNYGVRSVMSGGAGLEALEEKEFDLVIVDLNMIGIDGYQIHRWICEHRPHLLARLIFTTGNIYDHRVETLMEETGAACLAKPFSIDKLLHMVQQGLLQASKIPSQ